MTESQQPGAGKRMVVIVVVAIAAAVLLLVLALVAFSSDIDVTGETERTIEQLPESITPPGVDVDPDQPEGAP